MSEICKGSTVNRWGIEVEVSSETGACSEQRSDAYPRNVAFRTSVVSSDQEHCGVSSDVSD